MNEIPDCKKHWQESYRKEGMMADKPDFESLFLQAYNMLSKRFADIEFNTPEYEETDKFLTAHRDIFHNAAEVELPYI